jgi:3-phenylpropionate/trans-cinnamate dioxygenase ferredoxin subunit
MAFVRVLDISELPEGQMVMVVVGGREVLVANVDGSYYAIANRCTHLGGNLSKGKLEGSVVTCPRHGSQFDVKTGQSIRGPKIAFLTMKAKDEETYTVKVEGTTIMIGEPH